jgi:hypothetical protein
MSDNVDRRIVEMRFDNEQFEKNVSQTLITLDTLKKALEMSDAGKGLEQVTKAADRVDFSTVQNGVEQTTRQFSTMEIVAVTALANITNSAVNAGKRLVASFVNPLIQGGKSRAQNMAQAEFMFGGLGYAQDKIGAVGQSGTIMDNIYKSVEGTFYSLDKAALVGSQLMAAGIDGTSNDLTRILKGVAGVASMFGADYQRVGEIFAKVKTQGRLMGQDLMSLNSYGVPTIAKITEYLNKDLPEGARKTQEEVSDMVSKGKIDFELFSNAMDWAFGKQAAKSKQLFTGAVEDMKAAMARIGEKLWKPILNFGKDWFNATVPVIDNINSALSPAIEKFGKIVDAVGGKVVFFTDVLGALFDYNNSIEELTALTDEDLKDVTGKYIVDPKRVKALKEAFDSGPLSAFRDALEKTKAAIEKYPDISFLERLYTLTRWFGNEMEARGSDVWIDRMQDLRDGIEGVATVIRLLKAGVTSVINAISPAKSLIPLIADTLFSLIGTVGRFLQAIDTPLRSIGSLVSTTLGFLFNTIADGAEAISNSGDKIVDFFRLLRESISPVVIGMIKAFGESVDWLQDILGNISFGDVFKGLLQGGFVVAFYDLLKNLQNVLQSFRESGVILGSLGQVFNQARLALLGWQVQLKANILLKIGAAILAIGVGLKVLSSISPGKLAAATGALSALFVVMAGSTRLMRTPTIWETPAKGLIKMAAAVTILAFAVDKLSNVKDLKKGLLGVGALLGEIAAFSLFFSKLKIRPRGIVKAGEAMILIGVAIRMLVKPVQELGSMNVDQLKQGLSALGGMLAGFAIFAGALKLVKPTALIKAGLSMVMMAGAINMLIKPIKEISSMDPKAVTQGLKSIAIALAEMAGYAALMGKMAGSGASIVKAGLALVLMATGVTIMSGALNSMSNLDNAGKGLSVLFGSLVILAGAMLVMQRAIPGAAAMIIVAGALAIMAPAITLLSSLNLAGVGAGLLALAGTLIIFAGASVLLAPAIPLMIALGAALALLGVGVLSIGAGLTLVAAAFMAGMEPIMSGLEELSNLIPVIATNLARGLSVFLLELVKCSESIFEFFDMLWEGVIKTLTVHIPAFSEAAFQLLVALLTTLRDHEYELTVLGAEIVVEFLNGISSKLDDVIDAALNLAVQFFYGVANGIAEKGPELVAAINDVVLAVLEVLAGAIPFFGKYAADAIANYRDAIKEGLSDNQAINGLKEDSGKIKKTVEEESEPDAKKSKSDGANVVKGMISGIDSQIPALRAKANEVSNIVDDVIRKKNQIQSPSKRLMRTGEFMMMGLIAGIDSLTADYQNRADSISTMMIDSFDSSYSSLGGLHPVIDPVFGTADLSQLTASVNFGLDSRAQEERALASNIAGLTKSLNSMTDTMNSRSLNVYNTIDGTADPEAFADGLLRSFKLNARTV